MRGKKLRAQDIHLIRRLKLNPGEYRMIEETPEKIVYISIKNQHLITVKKKPELDD